MKKKENDNVSEETNWTQWVIILLDFFYTTGMPFNRQNDMRNKSVKIIGM